MAQAFCQDIFDSSPQVAAAVKVNGTNPEQYIRDCVQDIKVSNYDISRKISLYFDIFPTTSCMRPICQKASIYSPDVHKPVKLYLYLLPRPCFKHRRREVCLFEELYFLHQITAGIEFAEEAVARLVEVAKSILLRDTRQWVQGLNEQLHPPLAVIDSLCAPNCHRSGSCVNGKLGA